MVLSLTCIGAGGVLSKVGLAGTTACVVGSMLPVASGNRTMAARELLNISSGVVCVVGASWNQLIHCCNYGPGAWNILL